MSTDVTGDPVDTGPVAWADRDVVRNVHMDVRFHVTFNASGPFPVRYILGTVEEKSSDQTT